MGHVGRHGHSLEAVGDRRGLLIKKIKIKIYLGLFYFLKVAYSAINEADKVHYIQYIKELPSKEARNAEMAVLTGNYQDAENILLQGGLIFRAILLNIYLHLWEKALDLGIEVIFKKNFEGKS